MLGLRPIELTVLVVVLGLIAYDFYRASSNDRPARRRRYAIYGLVILVSTVALDLTRWPQ